MHMEAIRRRLVKQNQIYIIPSLQGFLYLAAIAVIVMIAATYNNNLVFVLGFFMFSVFLVTMLQTHYNIRGVRIRFLSGDEGFAGEPLALHFELSQSRAKSKQNLLIRTHSHKLATVSSRREGLGPGVRANVCQIEVQSAKRGVFKLPDVILETYYPLGLFRAWKVFRFSDQIVVYPKPQVAAALSPESFESGSEDLGLRTSPEGDFGELRAYKMGESYHQIAWKHYARTGQLFSKVHWGEEHRHYKIPWLVSGRQGALESELSIISGYVQAALEDKATFEMTTPKHQIEPGSGLDHARLCWRVLAEFGAVT